MRILEVDIDKCLGCHTCELECAVAHSKSGNLFEAIKNNEKLYSRIFLIVENDKVIPMQCFHCKKAPCISVCPTNALKRESAEDIVVLNLDDCITCFACIKACPFGVIKYIKDLKLLSKCDLCIKRIKNNLLPACAESCPTKAIRFIEIDDLNKEKQLQFIKKFKLSIIQGEKLKSEN